MPYLIPSLKSQSNEVTGQRNFEAEAALVGNFLKKFAGLAVPDKGRFVGKQPVHLKKCSPLVKSFVHWKKAQVNIDITKNEIDLIISFQL